jgi:hypothetical protein
MLLIALAVAAVAELNDVAGQVAQKSRRSTALSSVSKEARMLRIALAAAAIAELNAS